MIGKLPFRKRAIGAKGAKNPETEKFHIPESLGNLCPRSMKKAGARHQRCPAIRPITATTDNCPLGISAPPARQQRSPVREP
jgi:hypothetical protein